MFGLNKKLKARIQALESFLDVAFVDKIEEGDNYGYYMQEDFGKLKRIEERLKALEDKTGITKEKESNKTRGLNS